MPRPRSARTVLQRQVPCLFRPAGVRPRDEPVVLGFDEAEALRLADLEGLYQEAAALRMGVSRQTFGRIIESGRRKVADAITNRRCLRIAAGDAVTRPAGERRLRIAVAAPGGRAVGHFRRCERFMVYTAGADGVVDSGRRVDAPAGRGRESALASGLARMGVTHLVAGAMETGAVHAMRAHGIEVVQGANGPARDAAEALARGKLADVGGSRRHHEHGRGGVDVDVV